MMTSSVHEKFLLKSVEVAFHVDHCADWSKSWMIVHCAIHMSLYSARAAREPGLNGLLPLKPACLGFHNEWGAVLNLCQVFIYRENLYRML